MTEPHTTIPDTERTAPRTRLHGYLAEFEDVGRLLAAARQVRDRGFRRWDAYSPFPVHGLDEAMGQSPTRLPWIVLAGGLTGLIAGLGLTWWTNSTGFPVPYAVQGSPFLISGKPIFSLPANIPVIFETTILLAAFGAVFGMLLLNRLPRLYHPLFRRERFRRVTQDRFFVVIEADDPRFDQTTTPEMLHRLGADTVEHVRG